MRVIRINAVYGLSSTGRTVKQLDEGLKKYGVDSTTVYFAGEGTERDLRMNSPRGVKLHGLMARLTGKSGYYSRHATRKVLKYLEEQKPDIVHIHNLHSNFICLPMLFDYLGKKKIPTALTLDDCWWFTGKCSHYTADGCSRWLESCGSCPRLKKDIPSWFFDRTKKLLADKKKWLGSLHPLAVMGVSDWVINEAKKTFLGSAEITKRVYNWIDTDVFKPTESEIRAEYGLDGKFVLLAVASKWMESKGWSAFMRLAERLPDDMKLVMIGRIPQGWEETARKNGVLTIPSTESQNELAEWYSAADVFVSLSPEESFGKVSAEALSCGTPIIAMNSTASPELVGENCGAVLKDNETDTVLRVLQQIKDLGKNALTLSCRRFALESFEKDSCIEQINEVYDELLKLKGGAGSC